MSCVVTWSLNLISRGTVKHTAFTLRQIVFWTFFSVFVPDSESRLRHVKILENLGNTFCWATYAWCRWSYSSLYSVKAWRVACKTGLLKSTLTPHTYPAARMRQHQSWSTSYYYLFRSPNPLSRARRKVKSILKIRLRGYLWFHWLWWKWKQENWLFD